MAVQTNRATQARRRVPWWFRAGLQALSATLPGVGAQIFERLWFTPPRPRIRESPPVDLAGYATHRLQVRGRSIVGFSAGLPSSEPPILLVHGWGGYALQFAPLAAELVARGKRIVAYDMPAHGGSDPSPLPGAQTTFFEFERALQAIATAHGEPRAIVAHSGGCVAVMLALQARLATSKVVFISPFGRPAAFVEAFGQALGASDPVLKRFMVNSGSRYGFRWSDLEIANVAPSLKTPPLLVVHDEGDTEVPHSDGAEIAARWPDARLLSTRGLGHRRILSDSEVLGQISEFIEPSKS
ncbi:MAG: alpha/beta fold hydrolase [Myxococcota bacterium]